MKNFTNRLVSGLLRNRDGSAAIEFAMIAPIFFALIFSAFEVGLMYVKIARVEAAMADVTRKIYTGQAEGGLSRDDLINEFCGYVESIMQCSKDNVTMEVRRMSDYEASEDEVICLQGDEDDENKELPQYTATTGGDVVYVRFCITTALLVPDLKNFTFSGVNLGLQLNESAPGRFSVISSTVFRNEPFAS